MERPEGKRDREEEGEGEGGPVPPVEELVIKIVRLGTPIPNRVQREPFKTVITLHQGTLLTKGEFSEYFPDDDSDLAHLIFDTLLYLPMYEYQAGTIVNCIPQGKNTIFEVEKGSVARMPKIPKIININNDEVSLSSIFRERADVSQYILSWMPASSLRALSMTHVDAKRLIEKHDLWRVLFKRDFPELYDESVLKDQSCLRVYASEFFENPKIWRNPCKAVYDVWENGDFSGTPLVQKMKYGSHMSVWKDKTMTMNEEQTRIEIRCLMPTAEETESPLLEDFTKDTSGDFKTLFELIADQDVQYFHFNDSLMCIRIRDRETDIVKGFVIDYKTRKFPFGFSVDEPICTSLHGSGAYILDKQLMLDDDEYDDENPEFVVVDPENEAVYPFPRGTRVTWGEELYFTRNTKSFITYKEDDPNDDVRWCKLTNSGVKQTTLINFYATRSLWYASDDYVVECTRGGGIRLFEDDRTGEPHVLLNHLTGPMEFLNCFIAGHFLFVFTRNSRDLQGPRRVHQFNLKTREEVRRFEIDTTVVEDHILPCTLGPVILNEACGGEGAVFVFLRPPPP